MKYLKKYSSFNEEDEFHVNARSAVNSDNTETISDINKVNKYIDEYNNLKPKIDNIYKTSKTNDEIEKRINSLFGSDKQKARNPFLLNYKTAASDERKVRDMVDARIANKLKADEYNDLISMSDNATQKAAMQAELAKLKKKMSEDDATLAKLKTDINKRKRDVKTNISAIEKDMQSDIKNIS